MHWVVLSIIEGWIPSSLSMAKVKVAKGHNVWKGMCAQPMDYIFPYLRYKASSTVAWNIDGFCLGYTSFSGNTSFNVSPQCKAWPMSGAQLIFRSLPRCNNMVEQGFCVSREHSVSQPRRVHMVDQECAKKLQRIVPSLTAERGYEYGSVLICFVRASSFEHEIRTHAGAFQTSCSVDTRF